MSGIFAFRTNENADPMGRRFRTGFRHSAEPVAPRMSERREVFKLQKAPLEFDGLRIRGSSLNGNPVDQVERRVVGRRHVKGPHDPDRALSDRSALQGFNVEIR